MIGYSIPPVPGWRPRGVHARRRVRDDNETTDDPARAAARLEKAREEAREDARERTAINLSKLAALFGKIGDRRAIPVLKDLLIGASDRTLIQHLQSAIREIEEGPVKPTPLPPGVCGIAPMDPWK
ncbi:MAG: hypothetical protein ACREAC_21185 [Blastocatellia bacterium]